MSTLLFSTTVLAAFIGGILALVAPCWISMMLPAYFASTFRRRTQIVGMTLLFAAGVGTVILPIALVATILSRVLIGQHVWVFGIGGLIMVAAGLAMLAGKTFSLPMLRSASATDGSLRSVYGLGVFSGGASACCAPNLTPCHAHLHRDPARSIAVGRRCQSILGIVGSWRTRLRLRSR